MHIQREQNGDGEITDTVAHCDSESYGVFPISEKTQMKQWMLNLLLNEDEDNPKEQRYCEQSERFFRYPPPSLSLGQGDKQSG